jgi:hypothetical protein
MELGKWFLILMVYLGSQEVIAATSEVKNSEEASSQTSKNIRMGIRVGNTNDEEEDKEEKDSFETEVNSIISYRMEVGGRTTLICPFSQNMEFYKIRKDASGGEQRMTESSRIEVLYDSLVIDEIS